MKKSTYTISGWVLKLVEYNWNASALSLTGHTTIPVRCCVVQMHNRVIFNRTDTIVSPQSCSYRTDTVKLAMPFLYDDSGDDVFEREPYAILVRSKLLGELPCQPCNHPFLPAPFNLLTFLNQLCSILTLRTLHLLLTLPFKYLLIFAFLTLPFICNPDSFYSHWPSSIPLPLSVSPFFTFNPFFAQLYLSSSCWVFTSALISWPLNSTGWTRYSLKRRSSTARKTA